MPFWAVRLARRVNVFGRQPDGHRPQSRAGGDLPQGQGGTLPDAALHRSLQFAPMPIVPLASSASEANFGMISFLVAICCAKRLSGGSRLPQFPARVPGRNRAKALALYVKTIKTQGTGCTKRVPVVLSALVAEVNQDRAIGHSLLEFRPVDPVPRHVPEVGLVPFKLHREPFVKRTPHCTHNVKQVAPPDQQGGLTAFVVVPGTML